MPPPLPYLSYPALLFQKCIHLRKGLQCAEYSAIFLSIVKYLPLTSSTNFFCKPHLAVARYAVKLPFWIDVTLEPWLGFLALHNGLHFTMDQPKPVTVHKKQFIKNLPCTTNNLPHRNYTRTVANHREWRQTWKAIADFRNARGHVHKEVTSHFFCQ